MIKIFISDLSGFKAAEELNSAFEEWKKKNKVEIIGFQSSSSSLGWMLVVHYQYLNF